MGDINPRALPLDLVRCIAIYCLPSELLSLASLDRSCHSALIPTLYQDIRITQVKKIISFCDTIITGQPVLRSYPKSIHLEPSLASTSDLKSPGPSVRRMLSLVPNLLDLTLLVPDDVASEILDPSPDHSPMLTRPEIGVVPGHGLLGFLERQEKIEDIVFKEVMPRENPHREADLGVLIYLSPTALPLLKRADGFFLLFHPLNLTLSLEAVYLRGPVPLLLFTEFVNRFSSSRVPMTCLGVDLDVMRWSSQRETLEALVASGRLGGSLEQLRLRLFIRGEDHTAEMLEVLGPSYTPPHGLDEIRELLSPFTALRDFELTSSDGTGPPMKCLAAPELSQFELWRKSCPTLQRVSIYDIVLSAE